MVLLASIFWVLDNMRQFFFALPSLQKFGGLLHIVFFLIPIVLVNGSVQPRRPSSKSIILFIASLISFITAFLFADGESRRFSEIMIFSLMGIFPLIFETLGIKREDFYSFAQKSLKLLFYFGSAFLILEFLFVQVFELVSQCDFATWMNGQRSEQYCDTTRKMLKGFLIYKDFSLALVMASFFATEDFKNKKFSILNTILMVLSLFVVDSITLTLVFVIGLTLKFWDYLFRKPLLIIVLVFSFLNLFIHTSTFDRILAYYFFELDLKHFLPRVGGCSFSNFLIGAGKSEVCQAKEFHTYAYFFKYGLIPTISWYILFPLNLIFFIVKKFKKEKLNNLIYFNIILIVATVHYSGLESWAANYMFVLLTYFVILKDFAWPSES